MPANEIWGSFMQNLHECQGALVQEDCVCTKGTVTMCMKRFLVKSESTHDAGVYFPRAMKWGGNLLRGLYTLAGFLYFWYKRGG